MSEASRVPQSIVPVRHRMPFIARLKDNADRLHRLVKGEKGGAHRMPSRAQYGIRANLGAAAVSGLLLAAGLTGAAKHSDAETTPSTISQEQQHALTTKRYETCRVMGIEVGAQTKQGRKVRVDWLLEANVATNTILQQYAGGDEVLAGPTVPVVRSFRIDTKGRVAIGGMINAETVDTDSRRHNPDHFYAVLPEPADGERYALSVGNSLLVKRADGTLTRAYGEQQCAELVWHAGTKSEKPHWEYQDPSQALTAQDRYAVTNLPADHQ